MVMKASRKIKQTHYADIDLNYNSKTVFALCEHRVPMKETTTDKDKVTCFLCWEKLQKAASCKEYEPASKDDEYALQE